LFSIIALFLVAHPAYTIEGLEENIRRSLEKYGKENHLDVVVTTLPFVHDWKGLLNEHAIVADGTDSDEREV
jgi:hypothetical protein